MFLLEYMFITKCYYGTGWEIHLSITEASLCENIPFCSLFEQLMRETYGGWKFKDHKSLLDCIMNSGPGDTILSFQLSHLLY